MNEKQNQIIKYFNELRIFNKRGSLGSENKLRYYINYLFKNIDLKNKVILDIGSGYGLYTSYMAAGGAKIVVSVEPELDGGTNKMIETIKSLREEHNLSSIQIEKVTFQNFSSDLKFDFILMHNCINHLNEEACELLLESKDARTIYIQYFKTLSNLMDKDGQLIITDVDRNNVLNKLFGKNPFAPTVEYKKHQDAKIWADIAEFSGLKLKEIDYNRFNFFGKIFRFLIPKFIARSVVGTGFKIILQRG